LVLNKSDDFVGNYKWKRIITGTGETTEEMFNNFEEQLEKE
jgi:hypothetical protein